MKFHTLIKTYTRNLSERILKPEIQWKSSFGAGLVKKRAIPDWSEILITYQKRCAKSIEKGLKAQIFEIKTHLESKTKSIDSNTESLRSKQGVNEG